MHQFWKACLILTFCSSVFVAHALQYVIKLCVDVRHFLLMIIKEKYKFTSIIQSTKLIRKHARQKAHIISVNNVVVNHS